MSHTIRLSIPGKEESTGGPTSTPPSRHWVEKHAAVVVSGDRSAADERHVVDAESTDVLELEWEGGIKQWVSVEQLRDDLAAAGFPIGDGELRIPQVHPRSRASRGITDWVLKALKVLERRSPTNLVADLALAKVVAAFEDDLEPAPGLYRWSDKPHAPARIDTPTELAGDAPVLVLLHGTFASVDTTFGKLFGTPEWQALRAQYGDRIVALQHKTLSVSPARNALDLMERMPEGATLHLLTHSRGGLVGELLCRPALGERELALFAGDAYAEVRRELEQLIALLQKKRPRIERFVRVACPARGTPLAGKRLDLYLSVVLNLLSLLPYLHKNPIVGFVKDVLLEIARRRAKPEELPGLEAMMPESPFIHLLNHAAADPTADLAVIAGDIQADGILGRLAVLATDLYYLEDHDLVVNTRSMHGGLARESGVHAFLDVGPEVNHFNYFANARTRARAQAWLHAGHDPHFTKLAAPAPADRTLPRGRVIPQPDRSVLFVVPGIMGSELADGKGVVWVDPWSLAVGGMGRLAIERSVEAVQPLALVYEGLIRYMQQHYEVHEYAFDWRRPIRDASTGLADAIERVAAGRQVHVIAHSMGGLVARGMVVARGKPWAQISGGGRLVMLGTPNLGSYVILRLLAGREPLLRMLSLVDLRHNSQQMLSIVSRFPGVLEMLPANMTRSAADYFDPSFWEQRPGVASPPSAQDLRAARKFRDELDGHVDADHMLYVAGVAPATPCGVRAEAGRQLEFEYTSFGDGRVTYELGILKGVRTYYMNAEHGSLASTPKAFPALVELLERGDTDKLPTTPPAARGDVVPDVRIEDELAPLLYPTQQDLVAAAIGASPAPRDVATAFPVRLCVTHGSLHVARHPVAVGHYEGDTIVHAEEFLDRQLGGRLVARHRLDLYPGSYGSSEIVLDPLASPPGAVVIGLGKVGGFSRKRLTELVAAAARKLALTVLEREMVAAPASGWRSAAFSALLLGSNGQLAIDQSIGAIVEGALRANRALRQEGLWEQVRVDEIEFIECYEDRARAAAHVVADLNAALTLPLGDAERIEAAHQLDQAEGARGSSPASNRYEAWWRQVTVKNTEGVLEFAVRTDRAAVEPYKVVLSPSVESLLARATSTTSRMPDQARTLFDLVVPRQLKEPLEDEADLALVVDAASATIPWEMLENRASAYSEPLAVRKGLVRQLVVPAQEKRREPSGDGALVIGEPAGVDPPLPGARAEGERVAELLSTAGYEVSKHIGKAPGAIVEALFERDYKVLHIAGHGVFEPDASGVLLGGRERITAAMIGQLQCIPPLVFLNCCHLAKVGSQPTTLVTEPSRLAASLAVELIGSGVRAVVAAGWAVDDSAANTFATSLYTSMLSGLPFGRSVRLARRETFRRHPATNTWGAYQCYGDPAFVLDVGLGAQAYRPVDPAKLVARGEMLDELDNVIGECRMLPRAGLDVMLNRVATLDSVARRRWNDADVLAKLGAAWAELGCFPEAVRAYSDALEVSKPTYPLIMIERLANLEDRYAYQLRRHANGNGAAELSTVTASELSANAEKRMKWLLDLEKTVERHALLGALRKRAARLASADERRTLLSQALDEYELAVKLARNQDVSGTLYYPLLNVVALRLVLADGSELRNDIEEAVRDANSAEARAPATWNRVALADAGLLRALCTGTLSTTVAGVVTSYRRALRSGATPRDIASVRDQLDFLVESLGSTFPELTFVREQIRT